MALTKITPQMFDTSAAGHDFNIDNGTFVVDASTNRVGIGTASPTHNLTVGDTSASDYIVALRGGVGGFFGWDDSANTTVLQAPNTRSLSFQVNSDTFSSGTEAMRIDSSGNVGIGTTSPDENLTISSTAPTIKFIDSDGTEQNTTINQSGGNFFIKARDNTSNGGIVFAGNGGGTFDEYMRITSAGKVGIGISSPSSTLDISAPANTAPLEINAATDSYNYATIRNAASTDVAYIGLGPALISGTASTDFALRAQAGNMIFATGGANERLRIDASGALQLGGTTDAGFIDFDGQSLQLNSQRNPNTGAFVNTGKSHASIGLSGASGGSTITFRTASANNTAATERMRIDSSGRVGIATASQSGVRLKVVASGQEHTLYCIGDNASYAPLLVDNGASSGTRFFTSFRINNSTKGNITSTGSVMVYGGTSDYRLKENVINLTGATDRLKQLSPKRFNFIGDTETIDGFLAHEVAAVVPVAVVGEKDAVDENGEVDAQQMDNGLLVPLLVATIQELEARLTALENN